VTCRLTHGSHSANAASTCDRIVPGYLALRDESASIVEVKLLEHRGQLEHGCLVHLLRLPHFRTPKQRTVHSAVAATTATAAPGTPPAGEHVLRQRIVARQDRLDSDGRRRAARRPQRAAEGSIAVWVKARAVAGVGEDEGRRREAAAGRGDGVAAGSELTLTPHPAIAARARAPNTAEWCTRPASSSLSLLPTASGRRRSGDATRPYLERRPTIRRDLGDTPAEALAGVHFCYGDRRSGSHGDLTGRARRTALGVVRTGSS